VVVTAYATIDTAVEAIRRGAADYLPNRSPRPDPARGRAGGRAPAPARRLETPSSSSDAVPDIDLDSTARAMRQRST
jgi:DNA-binding NtrC family response regulator